MFNKIKIALRGIKPLPTPVFEEKKLIKEADTAFKATSRRTFSAGNVSLNTASWLTQDIALNTLLESQLAIIRARSRKMARDTS
ncbi:MAG TPA: hypothetical protein DCO68_04815, partial [Methylophilaceae bacterium]|nr:hypothetical protein [Methylophilaceae bacterium]